MSEEPSRTHSGNVQPQFGDSFTLSLQLLRSCEPFIGIQFQVFSNVSVLYLYRSKIVIITSSSFVIQPYFS